MGGGDRWADSNGYEAYVGRWSRRVAQRFVPWLEAPYGLDWVDVGCGTGNLTRAILELRDPVSVVGVDPSTAFLAAARAALRDSRVEFLEGAGGDLPLPDHCVDAVVSGLVLNFLPEPERALLDMRRLLRPAGFMGAYVWDYAGEMQFMRRFWDTAVEVDPLARPIAESVRFRIAHPEALEAAFFGTGLVDVEVLGIEIPTVFRDFEDFWAPFLGGTGPAPGYLRTLDDGTRNRIRDRLDETLPRESDGTIDLIARAWAVKGRLPG